jgi:hypothetical protein
LETKKIKEKFTIMLIDKETIIVSNRSGIDNPKKILLEFKTCLNNCCLI